MAFVVFSLNVQAGVIIPDAGQIERELKKTQKTQSHQLGKPEPLVPESQATMPADVDSEQKIAIRQVHISGATKFSESVLQALVADLLVGMHGLRELEAAAGRITAYYRDHGYFLANAYIPEQDIRDGILNIAVLEGRLDRVKLNNSARVSDEVIFRHFNRLQTGEALQKPEIDRQLLLLRSTVGIDKVQAKLQGGASVGTSNLLVETTPSAPYNGRIQLSNYGNRYTGQYQLGAYLSVNSPLKIGDQFTIRAVGSDNDLLYGRLAYQLPLGGNGLRVGAAYSRNRYELGREYKSLEAYGTSETASLFMNYPLLLSQTGSLFGALTYENKKLNDRMDSVGSDADKQVQLVSMGLSGERLDTLNGGGRNAFDLAVYAGHLNMDGNSRQLDDRGARSNGDFIKASYMFNRLQRVTDNDTFSVTVSGQWAGNNLNSSEKYSLGGAYGVRAYPQGEASGDMGSMLNLELAHHFTPKLQGVLFYDYGHIRINQDSFSTADNSRTLAGAGVGVNAVVSGMQLSGYMAWATQGGTPLSEPASAERTPRLWVQLTSEF